MKDWTIMVYMAGDNNLSADMAYALQEIREVAKNKKGKINLLVYYDSSVRDVPTFYYDFSDYDNPFRIRAADTTDKIYPRNSRFGVEINENSARARSVLNFVDWCINKVKYKEDDKEFSGRKAANYAFIFSGHSFGFQDIGLFKDENANYYMTLDKLGWVFERIADPHPKSDSGEDEPVILGKKLGLLGFDSCVMSMLEVGYAFHKFAETMVASEGTIPNAGWTYGKLLEKIASGSGSTKPKDVAANMVFDFIAAQKEFTIGGISVDIAAWDLVKVSDVVTEFEKLVDNLLDSIKDEKSKIYQQIKRILLHVHWSCQSYMYEQNIDLMDFCRLLYEEIDSLEREFDGGLGDITKSLKHSCFEVMKKLDDCIILSGFSGGNYQYSNGMSLFFPWTLSSYLVSSKFYTDLHFYEQTEAGKKWNEFLLKYLIGVTLRPARNADIDDGRKNIELQSLSNPVIFSDDFRIPPNIRDRIPPNLRDRIPPNLRDRIPPNLRDRIPPNLRDRIPPNLRDRIPPNLRDRIFSGMALFMDQFLGFRNIDTPWNISGLTKDLKKKKSAKSE